jgi:hypothetical protein
MTGQQMENWSVGIKAALSFAVFLALQTAAATWFVSDMNTRLRDVESEQVRAQLERSGLSTQQALGNTTAARLEERLISQGTTLNRIERLLEDRP